MASFCGYASPSGEAVSQLLRYSGGMRNSGEYYGIAAESGVGICAASPFRHPLPFRLRLGRRQFLAACLGVPHPKGTPRIFSFETEKMLLASYICGGIRAIEREFSGDFAFVIQDFSKNVLLLSAFGEKTLFVGEREGVFWFSSHPISPCTVSIEKGLSRLRR